MSLKKYVWNISSNIKSKGSVLNFDCVTYLALFFCLLIESNRNFNFNFNFCEISLVKSILPSFHSHERMAGHVCHNSNGFIRTGRIHSNDCLTNHLKESIRDLINPFVTFKIYLRTEFNKRRTAHWQRFHSNG